MSKNNLNQKIIKIAISLIIVFVAIGQYFYYSDNNLHIYFLNVGQGDSIYVRYMNKFDLLIDGGPDNKVLSQLGEVMPFWDHKIDYLMLTHPHADHVTGLIDVMKRYEIGQILGTDATHTTNEYIEFLKLIKDKNIPFKLVRQGDVIDLGQSIKLNILWPNQSYYDRGINNLNNTSIVAKLTYNNFSTLFMGDAESDVQDQLNINIRDNLSNNPLKSAVMKVSHHGSINGANIDFINLVNPKVAVISVGAKNMFGHPAKSTLEKLQNINSQIFRTDLNGRVEIISDGQKFWTKKEK